MTKYILCEDGYEEDNSLHTEAELIEVAEEHRKDSYECDEIGEIKTLQSAIDYFDNNGFMVVPTELSDEVLEKIKKCNREYNELHREDEDFSLKMRGDYYFYYCACCGEPILYDYGINDLHHDVFTFSLSKSRLADEKFVGTICEKCYLKKSNLEIAGSVKTNTKHEHIQFDDCIF